MSKYRTEFIDEVARLVEEVNAEKPLDHSDFQLGVTEGKRRMSQAIGMLLAGTDVRPQTNDQWEAEVERWQRLSYEYQEYAEKLSRTCAHYAAEVRELKEQIKALKQNH